MATLKFLGALTMISTLSCTVYNGKLTQKNISNTVKNDELNFITAKNSYYEKDYEKAIMLLQDLAGKFSGEPEYFLALCYLNDDNDSTTASQAVTTLHKSVASGYSIAMWEIGRAYEAGIGVKKDHLTALDWYRKHKQAKKNNFKLAQFFISIDGGLVEKFYKDIFHSLLKKSLAGDAEAQAKIAGIYDDGLYVKRNGYKAFYWYSKSAKSSYKHAQLMLGYFYCRAIGVDADVEKSNYWLNQYQKGISCQNKKRKNHEFR